MCWWLEQSKVCPSLIKKVPRSRKLGKRKIDGDEESLVISSPPSSPHQEHYTVLVCKQAPTELEIFSTMASDAMETCGGWTSVCGCAGSKRNK